MHSVVIVIHVILAIGLVGVILLQRSEGGALGMGGGGGGLMSGRAAGDVLSLTTRWLAVGFFVTSISLTVLTGVERGSTTVTDAVDPNAAAPTAGDILSGIDDAADADLGVIGGPLDEPAAADPETLPDTLPDTLSATLGETVDASAAETPAVETPADDAAEGDADGAGADVPDDE